MSEKEKFQLEITMEDGQITGIKPLTDDLKITKGELKSLQDFEDDEKQEIVSSMQHGTMVLSGQNSPGWIVIRTARGYIRIWR